jgi:hypothetical protein
MCLKKLKYNVNRVGSLLASESCLCCIAVMMRQALPYAVAKCAKLSLLMKAVRCIAGT